MQQQIDDARGVLAISEMELNKFCNSVIKEEEGISHLVRVKAVLLRERRIYEAMSSLQERKGFFLGFLWIPTSQVDTVLRTVGSIQQQL